MMANVSGSIGIIGGADGPTAILVAGAFPWGIIGAVIVVGVAVALGVWYARKRK